jgi:hypothetical protein
MIEAGIAFARAFLGDAYPSIPLDEPELVAGIFRSMVAVAADAHEKLTDHQPERSS